MHQTVNMSINNEIKTENLEVIIIQQMIPIENCNYHEDQHNQGKLQIVFIYDDSINPINCFCIRIITWGNLWPALCLHGSCATEMKELYCVILE